MNNGKLQHELIKKNPSDQLQIRFARLLRRYGLFPSQYNNILRILRGEGKPLPILEIASRTITVAPGITSLIDRLEQAGYVNRLRCDKDRRVIYVALTDQAMTRLAALDKPLAALHEKLLGHLAQVEIKELIRLLEKVRGPLTTELHPFLPDT